MCKVVCTAFFLCLLVNLSAGGISSEPVQLEISLPSKTSLKMAYLPESGIYPVAIKKAGLWEVLQKIKHLEGEIDNFTIYGLTDKGTECKISGRVLQDSIYQIKVEARDCEAIKLAFEQKACEHFFGFGDVWNGTLSQKGKSIRMWVKTGTPDECCYVPFFISTAGYGVFVDDYSGGVFDMGEAVPSAWSLDFPVNTLTLYILPGPEPQEILKKYIMLTGRPPLPPRWSYLPWKWRNEVKSDAEVYEDAQMMQKYDIPCGVIMIDNPWQEWGRNSFVFDKKQFPTPGKMIKDLHRMGYKILVWSSPFTEENVPNFKEGLEQGYFTKRKDGTPYIKGNRGYIDFTNPAAVAWWKREIKRVLALGVDGFKLDRAQLIPEDAVFYDGSTGKTMHNKYGLLFVKTYYEACKEVLGDDFTLLPRAGAARSQSFTPAKWPGDMAGDFDDIRGLPAVIRAIQSASISGFPFWGSDIGGFEKGPASKECFIRWTQFGAFSPIMELGGGGCHEPWDFSVYDEETLTLYRLYARLHSALIPYIASYGYIAAKNGTPIVRPLFFQFPRDLHAPLWDDYEYMFGEYILVAPVYKEGGIRDIYLPEGTWIYWWDEKKVLRGPRVIKRFPAPLSQIPLFIRAGAIIPMEGKYVEGAEQAKYCIKIYPKRSSSFKFFDYEGEGTIESLAYSDSCLIRWANISPPIIFQVWTWGNKTKRVELDGLPAPHIWENIYEQENCWWHDSKGYTMVWIKNRSEGQIKVYW